MNFRKTVFLLLILTLLIPAASPAAQKTDNGTVRVLLTRPGLTDSAVFRLDGSYSLNGICFQRGVELTVSSRSGRLIVYYEGMSMDCGQSLFLNRHQTDGENGVRINGSYYLHPGSLSVSVSDGYLRAILYAPLEEYLLGVVPYEMSDSFPIEALKCQAIAARTYAYSRMKRGNTEYDLVDNTNDQAYMGINAENIHAAEAVRSTAGVFCCYQGEPIECYYTASNGGITEVAQHVWGGSGYPYLRSMADPYDIANPDSMVISNRIPKLIGAPDDLPELSALLYEKAALALSEKGYDPEENAFTVMSIRNISIGEPVFSMPDTGVPRSIVFSLLVHLNIPQADTDEEIWLSSPSEDDPSESIPAYRSAEEIVSVSVDVFPVLEKILGTDINSTNNEVYRITEEKDHFVITAGRYGHGVGMSQRGAQQMALSGLTCSEILAFYYPSAVLENISLVSSVSTPLLSDFLITPGPAATPTPRPTPAPLLFTPAPGEYIVTVNGISTGSSLNMRDMPGTGGQIIRVLYYGQDLIVFGETDDWYHVKIDSFEGYVMKKFVSLKQK